MPGGITPPGSGSPLPVALDSLTKAVIHLDTTTAQLANVNAGLTSASVMLRNALGGARGAASPGKPAANAGGGKMAGVADDLRGGLSDVGSAAQQVSGIFSGVLTGATQVVSSGLSSVSGMLSGNLGSAIGGAALALAGVAVTGMAAVAAVRGMVSAAQGFAAAAAPDGMKAVNDSFSILSGTIGTMLLPGFVLAGAVALTLADQLGAFVQSHSKEIAEWWAGWVKTAQDARDQIVDTGNAAMRLANVFSTAGSDIISAASRMAKGMVDAAAWVLDTVTLGAASGAANAMRRDAAGFGAGASAALSALAAPPPGQKTEAQKRADERSKSGGANATSQGAVVSPGFAKNFDSIIAAMKTANAGRVGYGDIASARERIQEQNLQTDLQKKTLEIQQRSLEILEKISTKIQPAVGR